jgi:type I restriction enzyme M protein
MTELSEIRQIIKDAKSIMLTEDHMDTDGVTVPELSWILFLKVFDYHEKQRASLIKGYKTILPAEIQWKSWAGDRFKGLTGENLIKFVDKWIPKLASLTGSKDDRNIDIFHDIFNDFQFNLRNGTKLRKVIDELDKIELSDPQDLENLGNVFENELISMRNDLKGKASFYTPRPIIKFIVQNINPNFKKSDKIIDLAAGTCGFLTESLKHMKKDVKGKEDEKALYASLYGREKKSRNYLLGMLNMMLQNIAIPNVLNKNTLQSTKISEIVSDDMKYDVIMTNPTFDEKEEKETANNLPRTKAVSDAALHFLYFAMKSLKENGRCGIILPNGPLFGSGVAADMKKELLEKYNLHTIVRLAGSEFAPYNGIQTNILFFDEGKPTKEIWYYRMKIREGLKNYNKSNPIQDSDFDDVLKWCKNKEKSNDKNGYKVLLKDIKDFNLDIKHPDDEEVAIDMSPHDLIAQIIADERKTLDLLTDVENLINTEIPK